MREISKYKVEKGILIPIFLFVIISVLTIFSAQNVLGSETNLALKQIIWYAVGFGLAYFIMAIGNKNVYKNVWILYIIGNIALLALLLFADPINNAKCWFTIKHIGTIQPSEFMKIILILTIGTMINNFNENFKNPTVFKNFNFYLKLL